MASAADVLRVRAKAVIREGHVAKMGNIENEHPPTPTAVPSVGPVPAHDAEARARQLFDQLFDVADPRERERQLSELSAGDPAVVARVRSLLDANAAAGAFLDSPTMRPGHVSPLPAEGPARTAE